MNFVTEDLELLTYLDEIVKVHLNYSPIISGLENFLSHSKPLSMYNFVAFMDAPYDRACFVSIHASEQHEIIIPLVQNIPIQEKLRREPFQHFLIMIDAFLGYSCLSRYLLMS